MGRRRPRIAKTAAAEMLSLSATLNFVDNFDAEHSLSPKRKDCKIDKSTQCRLNAKTHCESNKPQTTTAKKVSQLTTRSKSKTIKNFFQANAANQNTNINTNNNNNNNNAILNKTTMKTSNKQNTNNSTTIDDISRKMSDISNGYKLVESIDLTDGDEGDAIYSPQQCDTVNLFLQKPVLKLDIDEMAASQASSVKIKKLVEDAPVFSAPPPLSAHLQHFNCFNGNKNWLQLIKHEPSPDRQSTDDGSSSSSSSGGVGSSSSTSSCDSGVEFGTSSLEQNPPKAGNKRKPITPHRIVCHSPNKTISYQQQLPAKNTAITAMPPYRENAITCTAYATQSVKMITPPSATSTALSSVSKSRRRLIANQIQQQTEATKKNIWFGVKHIVADDTDDDENEAANEKIQQTKALQKAMSAKTHSKNNNNNKLRTATIAAGKHALTAYYPVRRSARKTKTAVEEEIMRNFVKAILEEREIGLQVGYFEQKGRGVITMQRFARGEFVVEYIGDLISMSEATEREKRYAQDANAGCYMYYFKHKNQQYCIDATADTGKLGRLVNHSRNGNLITKVVEVKGRPHLILIAKDDIKPGIELTYDYGDRSKKSLLHHPWLAT